MKKGMQLFTAGLLSSLMLAGCGAKESVGDGDTVKLGLNYELSGNGIHLRNQPCQRNRIRSEGDQ